MKISPQYRPITAVVIVLVAIIALGAWAEAPSPDQERVAIEMEALKQGYQQQVQHAYNEAIDTLAVKGRQAAYGSFQRHLSGIRTAYKDCREIIKGPQR